ncbi:probable ATP-dependent RNA helicase DDX46 [Actinia tenebrosa]|uniref:Probable ATP-dependent RNA helicase DDX46 n=1 Tax=Actinia tenebrosa TaxID=6105 RepID=A0A6P8IV40_ACTTE|nr:probable ATP-dependent RNA helicase DDX46 [Actinia tenebrosa]
MGRDSRRSRRSTSPSYERRRRSRSTERDKRKRSRSRDRERERNRDRDQERKRDRDRDRDRERGKEREKIRGRKRDRRRSKEKNRKRGHSSSSSKSSSSRSRSSSSEKKSRKRRSRSKSLERKRRRRSRERKRKSRSRSDSSSKSRSRSRERESKKSKSSKDKRKQDDEEIQDKDKKNKESEKETSSEAIDKISEQNQLDLEMQKRRERVEAWRAKKKREQEVQDAQKRVQEIRKNKVWSLEDDEEDDEADNVIDEENKDEEKDDSKDGTNGNVKEEDEDVDPLDAFMATVNSKAHKENPLAHKKVGKGKATFVTHVVSKKSVVTKSAGKRGELMEVNPDALEYSSEEEKEEEDLEATYSGYKTKKKKDLQPVDHNKVYYSSFRKDFYVEVPELAKMTPEELDEFRLSLENIQIRGKNCPKPVKTWAQTGVNLKILDVFKKNGYEKPTPIQAQAIPVIMSGRDMIGIAKTGSGKTLAFLIPMFRHVKDQPPLDRDDGPIAIIMTPTRELAIQIHRECKKFSKPLNLGAVCVYGGTGISEQIAELKRGAEIIVCTPGRMIDMLTANSGRVTNCRRCTYLVLDEADRMFDMGFEPQVMRIIDCIRPDRQTVMFSATFPRQMEALARRILDRPIEIQVGGRSVVCSDVEQHVMVIEEDNKFLKLLELLGVFQEKGSVLVFVEKQDSADTLFKDLLRRSYPCLSLHGGMDQFDRDSTIADFKNGVTKLMIATSVAARGLDVKHLNLVVNYDCPNHYEDYVHRVGRTGRAGNKGTSYTFITPEQGRFAIEIVKALENSEVLVPDELRNLANEYIETQQAEGKQITKTSGFSGKGFKFNEEEVNKVNEAKKIQKWALGLQDSDDEAEAAEKEVEEIDKRLDAVFSKKPHIKKVVPAVSEAVIKGEQKAKLNLAASIAAKINQKISAGTNTLDPTQQAASQIIKGGTVTALTGLDLAKQLAEKIHSKLNYEGPQEEPKEQDQKEVEAERYEDEVEINEFPQTARWKITSKDTIMAITEYSECAVTVRGTYFPPGKEPKEGERKIYLYIEGPSERAIQLAKVEIKRIVKEELVRLGTFRGPQQTGRYKVV